MSRPSEFSSDSSGIVTSSPAVCSSCSAARCLAPSARLNRAFLTGIWILLKKLKRYNYYKTYKSHCTTITYRWHNLSNRLEHGDSSPTAPRAGEQGDNAPVRTARPCPSHFDGDRNPGF